MATGAGTLRSVASLFSSVLYLTALSRASLGVLGDSVAATKAIVAAILLGAALGAVASKPRYRVAEAGVALYCLAVPIVLPWLGEVYLAIAPSIFDASASSRNVARFAFAALVLMPAGFFIGVTLRALRSIGGAIVGAALGSLTATHVLAPHVGLIATLAVATFVKAALPWMARPRVTTEPIASAPWHLPWKKLFVVGAVAAAALGVAYVRSLLALALQYPAVLPAAVGAVVAGVLLERRGIRLPASTPACVAAVVSGGVVAWLAIASPSASLVWIAVALGALGGTLPTVRPWLVPALLAFSLAALSLGIEAIAAAGAGLAFSVAARTMGRSGAAYAFGVLGALAVTALVAEPEPGPESLRTEARAARIAALLTSERSAALAENASSSRDLHALGFQSVVCASEREPHCLQEDVRSVLFESPRRYDVVALVGAPTRELYRLASRRLRRHGVVTQYLPLGRLAPGELYAAIHTMKSELAHVSLWRLDEGVLAVGSNEPLGIDLESLRALGGATPFDDARSLVVTDDDMERFLHELAALVRAPGTAVATDAHPIRIDREHDALVALENGTIVERLRSVDGLPFRGRPTDEEQALARAAFDRASLAKLARAWAYGSDASLEASSWLFDAMSGHDARELGERLGSLTEMTRAASTTSSCERLPRFVSRLERLPLTVVAHSGESLDGTEPRDAIDGTFDPAVGKGWRARSVGDDVSLDVTLGAPSRVGTVHLVADPIEGGPWSVRIFGRDPEGTWYPLASDVVSKCDGVRQFRLAAGANELDRLRVELGGGTVALHELWADAT